MTSPVSQTRFRCEYGSNEVPRKLLLDAERAQHLHRVRHHLDAGADAREALRLLVDLDVEAGAAQRRRRGQPAHAGADDREGGSAASHGDLGSSARR